MTTINIDLAKDLEKRIFPELFVALAEIYTEGIAALYYAGDQALDEQHPKVIAVSKKLGISPKQTFEIYIEPYFKENMDTETLNMIASLQSARSKYSKEPYLFEITPFERSETYIQYRWLLVQIDDMDISGMKFDNPKGQSAYFADRETIIGYVKATYNNQCVYCGKLDYDDQGNLFNNKTKLCHAKNCDAKGLSNPEDHPNCCFGKWRKAKKTFNRWLQRAVKRNESERVIIAYFKSFCYERLEAISSLSPPPPNGNFFHRFHLFPTGWSEISPLIGQRQVTS